MFVINCRKVCISYRLIGRRRLGQSNRKKNSPNDVKNWPNLAGNQTFLV